MTDDYAGRLDMLWSEKYDRLREAVRAVVDSGPSHDAAYWGLADHPTIAGADCQQMAWARDTLRAAIAYEAER